MTDAIVAGLVLGSAGSLHCALMCGPLVAATRHGRSPLYHASRVAMYVTLGGIAGLVGYEAQQSILGAGLAVACGVTLIAMAYLRALPHGRLRIPRLDLPLGRLLGRTSQWAIRQGPAAPVLLGALNGLLPCSLVYGALVAAAGMGSAGRAAVFMAAFGLATTPVLTTAAVSLFVLARRARLESVVSPLALALVGAMLILQSAASLFPIETSGSVHTVFHSHSMTP